MLCWLGVQICSVVEISGFFLCLLGAARITHRAQGIVSIATRWHMIMTSASGRSEQLKSHMEETDGSPDELSNNFNDCNSNSSDIFISVSYPQDPFSFQARQALGKDNQCSILFFNSSFSIIWNRILFFFYNSFYLLPLRIQTRNYLMLKLTLVSMSYKSIVDIL